MMMNSNPTPSGLSSELGSTPTSNNRKRAAGTRDKRVSKSIPATKQPIGSDPPLVATKTTPVTTLPAAQSTTQSAAPNMLSIVPVSASMPSTTILATPSALGAATKEDPKPATVARLAIQLVTNSTTEVEHTLPSSTNESPVPVVETTTLRVEVDQTSVIRIEPENKNQERAMQFLQYVNDHLHSFIMSRVKHQTAMEKQGIYIDQNEYGLRTINQHRHELFVQNEDQPNGSPAAFEFVEYMKKGDKVGTQCPKPDEFWPTIIEFAQRTAQLDNTSRLRVFSVLIDQL
jgi:hypothetical protein